MARTGAALSLVIVAFFACLGFATVGRAEESAAVPREIEGLRVTQVALGVKHSAAVTEDGSLWTWGDNWYGQLGDGTTEDRHEPVKIMDGVESVALGQFHAAAIAKDGSLWTWGANYLIGLDDGTVVDRYEPVKIMDGIVSVSLSEDHSAAIAEDGSFWMWGATGTASSATALQSIVTSP